MYVLKGEAAQLTKNGSGSRGEVAATCMVETGKQALMINNAEIQSDKREEDDNGVAICTSTPYSKPPAAPANEELTGVFPVTGGPGSAASPMLPCYSVGWDISLPFGHLLPQCCHRKCSYNALIAWSSRSDPEETGVVCLEHGINRHQNIRDLELLWTTTRRYRFISPDHEAAIRAFFA